MSITAKEMYELLPAVYRLRDAERGEPLRALVSILAEQAALVEQDITDLYDNWFIETCAPWLVPYLGDLLGARGLYTLRATNSSQRGLSQRAFVANLLRYRRRKGTASMLEQLARDVTGWDARVVEFFELLATTQYLNHPRPQNTRTPDLRNRERLSQLDTPFDTIAHTGDVRHLDNGRGKHNIPNIGIFLWRLQAYPLTQSPAVMADGNPLLYRFSPLGCDASLYNAPVPEEEIAHLAEPTNVPEPISRLRLEKYLAAYFGDAASIFLDTTGATLEVCNLSDDSVSGTWAHTPRPPNTLALDPELGRLAFGTPPATPPRVNFHYGFSDRVGGGEYERAASFDTKLNVVARVPSQVATLQLGLNAVQNGGAVEIENSGRYIEPGLTLNVNAGVRVEIRGANETRPTIVLTNNFNTPQEFSINGGADAEIVLNGLLFIGGALRVHGKFKTLTLRHCTFVPGLSLKANGDPQHVNAPSIVITPSPSASPTLVLQDCICGALDLANNVSVVIQDSIVDALDDSNMAFASERATILRSTIIGRTRCQVLDLASEVIFSARVQATRRQEGCARFSYVPDKSKTPRRYRCQPDLALQGVKSPQAQATIRARVTPTFTSLRYGQAAYAQLSRACAREIFTGAEDGSEMGVFSRLMQPQRAANLRTHLDEFLRFGLEAGVFLVT